MDNTIRIGDRTYHILFPDLLRPLNAAERDSLRTSIRERGVCVPVVIDETGGIIDGGNRASLAAELGLDSIPTQLVVGLDDSQKVQLAYQLNETRRQLSQADREEARKNRDRRLARIAAARAEGQSLRAIAATEGVSESQVRADIKELGDLGTPDFGSEPATGHLWSVAGSPDKVIGKDGKAREGAGAQGCAPAPHPEKVVGKDGKVYPAAKTPETVEERRQAIVEKLQEGKTVAQVAEEVGVSERTVKYARKQAKAEAADNADDQPIASKPKPTGPVDGWGVPIQPHAEEAFACVAKFDELLKLLRQARRLYSELALEPGGKWLQVPEVARCMQGDDGEISRRFRCKGIDEAIRAVENAKPTHTVCPWEYAEAGHPKDCRTCRGLHWTTPLSKHAVPDSILQRIKEAFGV